MLVVPYAFVFSISSGGSSGSSIIVGGTSALDIEYGHINATI